MAVKLGLWSLTLIPGEKYPLYVKRDFTITNAALSDDLASATGRSVLKVTHNPVNPAIYDSDSEIDSDDEDMLDDMPEEDEFELDEVEGFKEVEKAAKKVNGDAEMEDEDDEEEDDDDEDDDFSDDEVEVTNVICALTAGKIEQATIDLTFTQGDAVMFEITGENAVHLMGNYIMQPNPFDDDSDDEHDHDDYDEMYDDEDESEDDEEMAAFIEELKEKDEPKKKSITASSTVDTAKPKKTAASAAVAPTPVADKKRKAEALESPASKPSTGAADAGENLSKAQKKKLAKKAKTEGSEVPAVVSAKPAAGAQKVRK